MGSPDLQQIFRGLLGVGGLQETFVGQTKVCSAQLRLDQRIQSWFGSLSVPQAANKRWQILDSVGSDHEAPHRFHLIGFQDASTHTLVASDLGAVSLLKIFNVVLGSPSHLQIWDAPDTLYFQQSCCILPLGIIFWLGHCLSQGFLTAARLDKMAFKLLGPNIFIWSDYIICTTASLTYPQNDTLWK